MFWSIRLQSNTRLGPIQPKNNVKVSNVVLDLDSMNGNGIVSVWVSIGQNHTLLANLSQVAPQVQIDVAFGKDQLAAFHVRAPFAATVYLSGYYIIDEEECLSEQNSHEHKPRYESYDALNYQFGCSIPPFASNDAGTGPRLMSRESDEKFQQFKATDAKQQDIAINNMQDFSPTSSKQSKLDKSNVVPDGQQVLKGGVIIEDVSKGMGQVVKANSTVKLKYKVYAASSTFQSKENEVEVTLGKRKALSCWSIGVPGMKVGGIRRIMSPPNHAYGAKGIPPFIGGDTDVTFEVEVIDMK